MNRIGLWGVALVLCAGSAWAKIPAAPITDEQKAKAEAAKVQAAEAAKKEAALLGKYQDKAVDNYKRGHGKGKAAAPAKNKK